MENESLRESKNTTTILLLLVCVGLAIWAIVASVNATNRRKDFERVTAEKEALRVECDQVKQECMVKMNEAEKLRQTAMEWTRQHQLQVQEDMRKKAEEAAKAAKAKEEAAKKATTPAKGKDGKDAKETKVVPSKKTVTKPAPAKHGKHGTTHAPAHAAAHAANA